MLDGDRLEEEGEGGMRGYVLIGVFELCADGHDCGKGVKCVDWFADLKDGRRSLVLLL